MNFAELVEKSKTSEGLVLLGLNEDLEPFKEIISEAINLEASGTGTFEDKFDFIDELTTTGGRRDIVLMFKPNGTLSLPHLAIWRLKLGFASWVSDYVVNYADQHTGGLSDF